MAVVYADMVGYSRLIGLDDAGTLQRLRTLRRDVIDPAIDEFGGRLVNTGGDSLLLVFDSADGAVRCAIKVQQRVPICDGDQPADRAIRFRVGIHVGDAIADGTDVHGDVVNVTARIQAQWPPGSICVTRAVRDQVHGRLDFAFEELGALNLKNIAYPVEAFAIKFGGGGIMRGPAERQEALPESNRPCVAVLPFQNMSGDPEQDYLAFGVVEEVVTALSRMSSFSVISLNSSFAYKGKSPDVRQESKELGVRYVLEGSVRKAAGRVRIAGQLIDATTGAHLWADRFEGELTDIFGLQDQVTVSVVAAIEPHIRVAEVERVLHKPPENLKAYELALRGRWTYECGGKTNIEEAARLFRHAIASDPNYGRPYAYLARSLFALVANQWTEPSEDELAECVSIARTAVRLGQGDPETLRVAAQIVALPGGELEEGIAIIDRALMQTPNSVEILAMSGILRAYAGDTEIAFRHLRMADMLTPPGVHANGKCFGLSLACLVDGDYAGVIHWTAQSLQIVSVNIIHLRYRTAALALLGRLDEANQTVKQMLALNPSLTISWCRAHIETQMKNPFKRPGVVEAYYEGLRLAGLPE